MFVLLRAVDSLYTATAWLYDFFCFLTEGKGPVLLAVNKLAMQAEEVCKEPEPEEEYNEDDDDDLMANPNRD